MSPLPTSPDGAAASQGPHQSEEVGVPGLTPHDGAPGQSVTSALGRRSRTTALFFTAPTWALIVPVAAVPLLIGVWLSLRDQMLGSSLPTSFVGLDNYRSDVLNSTFGQALIVTLTIVVVGLLIQIPLGLLLAVLLNRRIRGARFFRSSLITPMLLTPVAVGLMWRFTL